jgi:hypothetical protein
MDNVDEVMPQAQSALKPLSKTSRATAPGKVASKQVAASLEVAAVKDVQSGKTSKASGKSKSKIVRDSFTMPASEYLKIAQIKELCLKAGIQVKKSEVLRAGVIALCAMSEEQLNRTLNGLDKIKTGRPNK